MSRPSPWSEIALPVSDFNVRRVAGSSQVPLFWGRDTSGSCLFIIELEGDHTADFRRDKVNAHGIGVDLRDGDIPGIQRLVITLDRSVDQDVFLSLCDALVSSLAEVPTSVAAFSVAMTHLRRWKAFWAGRKSRILRPEEVRGLFAELQFLRSLYEKTLSHPQAVSSWTGPDSVHQDFIFGNCAIEIKSLWGRDRNSVRISSEDQMQTVSDRLFLVVYRLSEADESAGHSLNELVRLIEEELADAAALEEFSAKLSDFGYLPLLDYDEPRFRVTSRQGYLVEGEFPRLTRASIPSGIVRLSYEIELEAMSGFECDDSQILLGG